MSRAARATVDPSAIQHNLAVARARAPRARVMAVIKANAYGHGIATTARALEDADAFAVSSVDEAGAVRAAGLRQPVVLLEGAFAPTDLAIAARDRFEVVVHNAEQLAMLREHAGPPVAAWLKVDTGMRRLGFRPEDLRAAHAALVGFASVAAGPGLMTHLARADQPSDPFTAAQLDGFAQFGDLPGARSIANSAGVLAFPAAHADWVRPGLMLFGASPFDGRTGFEEGLRPAMTFRTTLIAVREVRSGEAVGYRGTWTAPRDVRIGIAAIGYGDGYPWTARSGTELLVDGAPAPLVGRVAMDMLAVDLDRHPQARVGSEVEAWGARLPVESVASAAGVIPYTLLCGITARVRDGTVDIP